MPKVLTEAQVQAFERDGCLSPIRVMSAERAHHYRQRFEALEARVPDIKKMKTKSHLLTPWVLEIAEDPHILDIFEDLVGPNLRCWSMAWRVKKADGETFAGWHQDSAYGAAKPVVLGGLALSNCGVRQGCLRGVPGSHKWGILKHDEKDDPKSILAWAWHPSHGNKFYLFQDKTDRVEVVGPDVMTVNGHCTYLPGNRWILNDTYPDKQREQNPYLYEVAGGKRVPLGHFRLPAEYAGEWRCDTHPRFSPDGRKVVIDSAHGGNGRQMYLIDISDIVG